MDAEVITAAALRVLDLFELDRPVRLLGVRLELAPPDDFGAVGVETAALSATKAGAVKNALSAVAAPG